MSPESPEKEAILIIDDSPTNLVLLSELLKESGFTVWLARDGETAICKVQEELPDLILLDVLMPGPDGFEICQRFKSNPLTTEVPIIFMTALSDPVDKIKGMNLGAVDYITKPFRHEEVLARVKIHLKIRKLNQSLAKQNQLLKQEIQERIAVEERLQKLTEELEKRVEERTSKLKQTMYDLQKAQVQLVQKEKMSTLGQLVAGVAHEINNPINFIAANLNHAEQYISDLLEHLQLYQEKFPDPGDEIETHAEEIDLDFLQEDLPSLVASMETGTDRIKQISVSLRIFSRSDTTAKVAVNIHEGIDSTLMILKHRLKANENRPAIEVLKEYGDLPLVECYAGQLNQVFMNLISNSIDAFDEYSQTNSYTEIEENPNTIIISTELDEQERQILIRINDNGPGMLPEAKAHLFEPLFTTKPLGKGTGLGLSISHQIVVEKHKGQLTCNSVAGKGVEFVIALPLS
ncbi:hybrid sensor histidine kinase/response regulator [[Phormidium ambiguum] IAM M-71]|uniref:histidine kinase n=1 Tax=[Phormidium ambiguum] IAM M-71 TaxID=454136 RepID=A0A1U7IJA0_9CYAN|nr:response regulator [Phormidium ambiguum]OKH37271.1 hybrid sensor histidine kinase/response regulator [Phormidium ambiguum IAM M-71]